MICFFYFTKGLTITTKEHKHCFEAMPENFSLDKVYFTTPSDFYNQMGNLKSQIGDLADEISVGLDPIQIESLPEQIGFDDLETKLEQFKGKPQVKLAIVNAMSNAIGDHLIGMSMFPYWIKRVKQLLPDSQVLVTLFQLNPHSLAEITRQHANDISQLYMLPANLPRLLEQDAFIDLGTLLLREGFDTENMMDFYLKALSVNPQSVPSTEKRIRYIPDYDSIMSASQIMEIVRSKKRPILLFHHSSTTPIRSLDPVRARKIVSDIIDKSDYFVISTSGLDYQNPRFMDVSQHCQSLDKFAAIIAHVNAVLTVDTCTYHFADAFDVPTVVLFSTINPDLRVRYYPHVKGIMYETPDGLLYGKHRVSHDKDQAEKELKRLEQVWDKIDVDEILQSLYDMQTERFRFSHGRAQASLDPSGGEEAVCGRGSN